jgi:hypothetical protein
MAIFFTSLVVRSRSAWLRFKLDARLREVYSIVAQRENDFVAERELHREIAVLRAQIRLLNLESGDVCCQPATLPRRQSAKIRLASSVSRKTTTTNPVHDDCCTSSDP